MDLQGNQKNLKKKLPQKKLLQKKILQRKQKHRKTLQILKFPKKTVNKQLRATSTEDFLLVEAVHKNASFDWGVHIQRLHKLHAFVQLDHDNPNIKAVLNIDMINCLIIEIVLNFQEF